MRRASPATRNRFSRARGIERGAQLRAVEEIAGRIDARITEVARKKLMDEGARLAEAQATSLALSIGTADEPKA